MKTRVIHGALLFMTLLLGACVVASTARYEMYEATTRAYERAIRWSEFGTALALTRQTGKPAPDIQHLKSIRVLSYEKAGTPRVNKEKTEVTQVVEIRYANVNNMSERSLIDEQTWVYSEADGHWSLRSKFPVFP